MDGGWLESTDKGKLSVVGGRWGDDKTPYHEHPTSFLVLFFFPNLSTYSVLNPQSHHGTRRNN